MTAPLTEERLWEIRAEVAAARIVWRRYFYPESTDFYGCGHVNLSVTLPLADGLRTTLDSQEVLLDHIAAQDAQVLALTAEKERLEKAVIATLGTYDTALSAATFTRPRTGQVILNVGTIDKLNVELRAALSPPNLKGA